MEVKRIESSKQSKDSDSYDNSMHYHNQEHRYISNLEVGKTIISEKFPSNMDGFWLSVYEGMIINSFDFVSVENLCNSRTVGIMKELQSIQTDNLGSLGKGRQKDITVAKVAVMGNTGAKLDGMKENTSAFSWTTSEIQEVDFVYRQKSDKYISRKGDQQDKGRRYPCYRYWNDPYS